MTDTSEAPRITLLWLGWEKAGSNNRGLLLNGTVLTQGGFEPRCKLVL